MHKVSKTLVEKVQLGDISFEGLKRPCGAYGIAVTQANELLSFTAHPGNAARSVKRILGTSFQPIRVATELNPNPAVILTIDQFLMLVRKLNQEGNKQARIIADSLMGMSLEQLFADAFGDRFEKEERQESLRIRQKGKIGRRTLTDAAMEWHLQQYGFKPGGAFYASMTDQTKELLGFPLTKKHRDLCQEQGDNKALELYDFCERVVASYIEGRNISPFEALALFEQHHPNKCKPKPLKHHWGALDLSAIM